MKSVEIRSISPWEIANGIKRLSVRGKHLVDKARELMGDNVPLSVEATRFLEGWEDGNACARHETDDGVVWCEIKVYTDHAANYERDGHGNTDYVLAHELGHAIRIATGTEPKEVHQVYWHIENTPELHEKARKNEYLKSQSSSVRKMLVDEEKAAWDIAEELMEGIDHEPDKLSALRRESVRGYEEDLLGNLT